MMPIPKFTLDALSDAQIAMLHGKIDRAWHKACEVFAQINVTGDPIADPDFRGMSDVISDLTDLRSDTYRQLQARNERFARGF